MPQLSRLTSVRDGSTQEGRIDTIEIEITQDDDVPDQPYRRRLRGRPSIAITVPEEQNSPPKKRVKRKLSQRKRAAKTSKVRKLMKKSNDVASFIENEDKSKNRSFHSCNVCNKDFASAFILCLHLQIHKKVQMANKSECKTDLHLNSTSSADFLKLEPSGDISLDLAYKNEEEVKEVNIKEECDVNYEEEEEEEEDDDDDNDDEKEEEEEEGEEEQLNEIEAEEIEIKEEKPVIGILNKNFVENLKKNLSMAMNRNL